jgi:hypothetical protein
MAESDESIMSGTGAGLIQFFESMAAKGRLPKPRAQNARLASQQVLQAVFDEEWEQTDVKDCDLEDVFSRFVNLKAASYSDSSFAAYKSRFTTGVEMYREFLQNPGGWKAPIKVRSAAKKAVAGKAPATGAGAGAGNEAKVTPVVQDYTPPGPTFISHTFPLRAGSRATLLLPEDLTRREAKRLSVFVESLAVDEQPALTSGDA